MAQGLRGTRREFVKLALNASVVSALSTYAARAQTPPVTRLKVGLTPPASEVTMGYQTQNTGTGPLTPMYECLIGSDRFTGQLVPQLATEWDISPDAKVWRFKLRPNISFHDGTLFTAKDVLLSWQVLTGPDSRATTASYFRQLIGTPDNIKITNDLEVEFNLSHPEPDLLFYLTQGFLIYSKDYWDKVGATGYAKQPIGTGPFKFSEFRPGEYILYEAVQNHWRQTPDFKELQLLYMTEDTTRLAALLAGEVHIAEIPRSVQNQAVAHGKKIVASTRPAVHLSSVFGGNYLSLKESANAGPLTNKLVREAMNLAVNRKEINDQIFGGRGDIEIVEPYQSTDPAFNPEWQPYPYDPAKAKMLLAQAGYPNGFAFDMTVVAPPGFPEIPDVVQALGIYFTAIGLRPNLVPMELATQDKRQRAADFRNTVTTSRQSMQPLFQAVYYYWSKGIYHFYEDSYIDQELDKFSQSVDSAERLEIQKDIGNFLYNEHATLPLMFLHAEVAIDPTVVAEYTADIGAFGASVDQEYTKAAR